MIKDHEKFKIPDENKRNEMVFEVNWAPNDSRTNECKMIKATFPDGTEQLIRREHLHAILFAISDEAGQRKLIPQTISNSRWYETVVGVTAKRDIKKGEEITFPIKLSLPTFEQEVIGEMKRDLLEKGQIIIPNK